MKSVVADRWRALLGPDAEVELRELVACYGTAGRHYHTIDHIAVLLDLSAEHAASLADRETVDLAILYHDVIYEPTRKDNEERSAFLARERLAALGRPAAQADTVARYIEATKHASAAPTGDSDLDHVLDFDLSILAAPPAIYATYAAAIRREYAIYPDLLYRPGRAKVLRSILEQQCIYRVPALAAQWEPTARANVTAELARLG